MQRKKIRRYLKKRMDDIEKYVSVILLSNDPEAIHQLRIGYKKLRAFLRLAQLEGSAKKDFVIPEKLKAIYLIAGHVRDLQIYYQHILPFFDKGDCYPHRVLYQIAEAKCKLRGALKGITFKKSFRKLKRSAPYNISMKTWDKFIQFKTDTMKKSIMTGTFDDHLHAFKKYLKDVYYSLNVFYGSARQHAYSSSTVNAPVLIRLGDVLNTYLDWVVCLNILQKAFSERLLATDKKKLLRIRKNWIHQMIIARNVVMNLLDIKKTFII